MQFEIGELVKIKENFNELKFKDDPGIDPKMSKYAGTITEIKRLQRAIPECYRVENNTFIWDARWLEPYGSDIQAVTENEFQNLFGE